MANGPFRKIELPAGPGSTVVAAVWKNNVKKGQQSFVAFSVSLQRRRYRDGDEWKTAESLRPQDLLAAAHALTTAYNVILQEKDGD